MEAGDKLVVVREGVDARRLTAVVHADVVGYSRLIEGDDAGTLERLRALRGEVLDPAAGRHGGRLISSAGDSFLVLFDSVIGAVRFAIEVQRAIPDFDHAFPAHRSIRLRMGVNLGDVIPDGANMHGEGVNIAARLESICPVGAVCVSDTVREQVRSRVGLAFRELGPVTLKNIGRTVNAFVIDPADLGPVATARRPGRAGRVWLRRGSLAAVLVLACLTGIFWLRDRSAPSARSGSSNPSGGLAVSPAASDSVPPPLSIAVLPFANISGDPEQAYLADGISEDLTTDLSHLQGSFVIARESAFTYRGRQIDIREVGRQLGVRYVLEGSVRKLGDAVRINAQLIAADSGAHIWAERFDRPLAALGEGADDVVGRIGKALDVQLVSDSSARAARGRTRNPVAADLVLRARGFLNRAPTPANLAIANGLFEQALAEDPDSVQAMSGVATMLAWVWRGTTPIKRAEELIQRAESIAPRSPDLLTAKFLLQRRLFRYEQSVQTFADLLDVDSSAAGVAALAGSCEICWVPREKAIPLLKRALQLNPRSPHIGRLALELGRLLLFDDRVAEALPWLRVASARSDDDLVDAFRDESSPFVAESGSVLLAAALQASGEGSEAHRILAGVMRSPRMLDFSVARFLRYTTPYDDPNHRAAILRIADLLRRAGLRETLDEDADSGIRSDAELRNFTILNGPTPMSLPGGVMLKTAEVQRVLAERKPLVLTTTADEPTVPGALHIDLPNTGNINDAWQPRLGRLMADLSHGDLARPILVFSFSINRWQSRNLALRLLALGYKEVYWYRGGWEAWMAHGMPTDRLARVKF